MKSKGYLYMLTALAGILMMGWGCTEKFPVSHTATTEGLVLEIDVDGTSATSLASRADNDNTLREAEVSTVDVFFLQEDKVASYLPKVKVTGGKAVLATGSGWKDIYRGTYDVYVLANKHDYDNPLTPEVEADLKWVTDKTALMALTDTDPDVAKAEGEEYAQGSTFTGKTFLMDGTVNWNADVASVNETLTVDLTRAAAKFQVKLSYTDGFLKKGWSIVGVRKKLVHYVKNAKAFAEAAPIDALLMEREGEPDPDGFSQSNWTEGGNDVDRKDKLYAYTYPNDWSGDVAERETYFLVNVPYVDESGTSHQNYYKVPVRVSSTAADLKLDRNTLYTINVTVDRLGNENIDEAKYLVPTFSIAPWKTQEIAVDGEVPNYLVVSETFVEMHNVKDTTLTFFSSTPIKVEVKEAYFIDKNGNKDENYTTGSGWGETDTPVKDLVKTDWDEGKLEGSITITSEIPTNVTARYITLTVTNEDKPTPHIETITIVQYPLEYISGVPGWYSTRDDFTASWQDHVDGKQFNSRPTVSNSTFSAKVCENSIIYQYSAKRKGTWPNYYYAIERSTGGTGQNNNRMYLVQVTSTSGEHTVARPATTTENGQLITVSDSENNKLLSPLFMLASQLGTVSSGLSWNSAKDQCKYYVEVVKYEDGTTHRFDDWRLPTEAEFSIVADYQKRYPEVMAEVLVFSQYWTALESKTYNVPNFSTRGTGARCVRDVTPEDLAEFRAHGIK